MFGTVKLYDKYFDIAVRGAIVRVYFDGSYEGDLDKLKPDSYDVMNLCEVLVEMVDYLTDEALKYPSRLLDRIILNEGSSDIFKPYQPYRVKFKNFVLNVGHETFIFDVGDLSLKFGGAGGLSIKGRSFGQCAQFYDLVRTILKDKFFVVDDRIVVRCKNGEIEIYDVDKGVVLCGCDSKRGYVNDKIPVVWSGDVELENFTELIEFIVERGEHLGDLKFKLNNYILEFKNRKFAGFAYTGGFYLNIDRMGIMLETQGGWELEGDVSDEMYEVDRYVERPEFQKLLRALEF